MKTLKEIIGKEEKIWIDINKEDFSYFLEFTKSNGCTWGNGQPINPQKDKCNYYMSINRKLEVTFVPAYCWYISADNSPKKYKFRVISNINL